MSEDVIITYASQLLSALKYLHLQKYIQAPGEINADRIFFNQMFDNILLDIGISSSSITNEWLFQNSESLLRSRKYLIYMTFYNQL